MFVEDIKEIVKENVNFRKVLVTGDNSQIVAMSIPVGGDIGMEVHDNTDQFFYFVGGEGEAVMNGEVKEFEKHFAVFVPAGVTHNIVNKGNEDLKLFTVYAPAQHPAGTVHATKEDAQKEENE